MKWDDKLSKEFPISRCTRQGSVLSPIFFNIFIDSLLRDLQKCNAGAYVVNTHINNIAYADDITLCATTVPGLQKLIDMCDV